MCKHLEAVLETMPSKKGGITDGSKIAFRAFAKDISEMDTRIMELSTEMQEVKKDLNEVKLNVANIDGKVDAIKELIESRLNSNIDEERLIGTTINRLFKSQKFWIFLTIILALFVFSGVAITYIINNPTATNNITDIVKAI